MFLLSLSRSFGIEMWPFAGAEPAGEPRVRLMSDSAPSLRTERLMASTRLALAAFSLFSLALDPFEPTALGWLRLGVVILYGVFAAALAKHVLAANHPVPYVRAIHAADIGACVLFCSLSGGIDRLFTPFFVFAAAAASLRWGWPGALWTSMTILAFIVAMAAVPVVFHYHPIEVYSFVLDMSGVGVTTGLVARIAAHKRQARHDAEKLVPPLELPGSQTDTLRRLAEWAAGVVDAPRVLIAWEEPDEPWLYLVWWDGGEFRYTREPPGTTEPLVAETLAEANFLCNAVETVRPTAVLCRCPDGVEDWTAVPLHPTLQARFAVRSLLSVKLATECFRGRLFFFDKHGLILDDLVLAELVARHVTTRLGHLIALRRFAGKTALDERLRLARDLHDGSLHSLAGVALEFENLLRSTEFERPRRVLEIRQSLLEEQRSVRRLIAELRGDTCGGGPPDARLDDRIEELAQRLSRQWGLRVKPVLSGLDFVPARLSDEVYRIVQEALINVARHAHASDARVEVATRGRDVMIVIADNGRGLAFKGRYEQAALAELHLGPTTLRERVTLLRGTVVIESSEFGTRLEIVLPVEQSTAA
jgi:signal transduction histidine kinase